MNKISSEIFITLHALDVLIVICLFVCLFVWRKKSLHNKSHSKVVGCFTDAYSHIKARGKYQQAKKNSSHDPTWIIADKCLVTISIIWNNI